MIARVAELPWRRWLPFALPAVVVVALLLLVRGSRVALAGSPRFAVDPSVVEVLARPGWMTRGLAERVAIELATALSAPATLLDDGDLDRWEERLRAASPWVADVRWVKPRFPSQADARLVLHRPVLVRADGVLVAASGAALGPGPVGLRPAPLAHAGPDDDRAVTECAAAAAEILPWRDELRAAGVELVSVGLDREGRVVFGTASGVELDWGRSRASSPIAAFDLPVRAKVDNLHDVLASFPDLRGLSRVSLWTDRPRYSVRPGPRDPAR